MIRAAMRAATVKVIHLQPATFARAWTNVQSERYRAWRRSVEGLKTATGARPTLIHVPEDIWRAGFKHQADPCSVVIDQLQAFDD